MSNQIKEIVVNRIIELIEKENLLPWQKSWRLSGEFPCNLDTKHIYRGVNAIMLLMAPYGSPYYLTFKGIKARELTIRKGEKPWPIYFCQFPKKGEVNKDGKPKFPIVRFYKVWNVDQLDGDIKLPKKDEGGAIKHDPIKACEDIIAGYKDGPKISFGGNRACYAPSIDKISVPKMDQFKTAEEFYSTLFHEAGHSTGHTSRLSREELTDQAMFGDHKYSKEELVAELTATILCATAGIEKVTIENSAAYIKHWLGRLKDEKLLLFEAAQKAQRACYFIQGQSFEEEAVGTEEAA